MFSHGPTFGPFLVMAPTGSPFISGSNEGRWDLVKVMTRGEVGCNFGELLLKKPLLPGKCEDCGSKGVSADSVLCESIFLDMSLKPTTKTKNKTTVALLNHGWR